MRLLRAALYRDLVTRDTSSSATTITCTRPRHVIVAPVRCPPPPSPPTPPSPPSSTTAFPTPRLRSRCLIWAWMERTETGVAYGAVRCLYQSYRQAIAILPTDVTMRVDAAKLFLAQVSLASYAPPTICATGVAAYSSWYAVPV
eukprot:3893662-Rhodomonas_salina.2